MDRVQLAFLGLQVFLLCSDIVSLFTPAPPRAAHKHSSRPAAAQPLHQQVPDFAAAQQQVRGPGYGNVVELKFCVSCSYKGNAITMKKMLETSFPGIEVVLSNYPPSLPKRLLSKLVPVAQVGFIGTVMAGEHIFPRLGMAPPQWYHSLRANRFGAMATTWLLGNFAQSFLQSTGAFEVYFNGDLVFSKLSEQRFPSEFELRQLIANKLPQTSFGRNIDSIWS